MGLKINRRVIKAIEAAQIDKARAIAYLVLRKLDLDYDWIDENTRRRVEALGIKVGKKEKAIFYKTASGALRWNVDPFEDYYEDMPKEMRDLVDYIIVKWRNVNDERAGDPTPVARRVQWFMKEYGATIDEVYRLVDLYVENIDNPDYIMRIENFFRHKEKGSTAYNYLQTIRGY